MTTVEIDVPGAPAAIPALPGDSAAVRAFASDLLTTSSGLDDLASFAGGVASDGSWEGAAAEAYGAAAIDTADDADAKSLVLRKVSGQVDDFADTMDALEARRLDLWERRGTLVSARTQLIADIGAATEVTDAQIAALQQRARDLRTDIDVLVDDHQALLDDVDAANQRMVDAFRAVDTQTEVRELGDRMVDPADLAMDRPGAPGSDGSTPEEVNDWWEGLSEAQQRAVTAAHPEIIGNTDGIPTDARDEANRVSLGLDLDALETRDENGESLTFAERRHLERAQAARDALEDLETREDPVTGDPVPGFLTLYDPTAFGGDGAVAVSVGNPDTADNVSVSVPGMLNDGASIRGGAGSAYNLYSAARAADPDASVASTMWIGYDAPSNHGLHGLDVVQVVDEGLADAGGERLADYLDGVRATRGEDPDGEDLDPAHLTVVGHSYGSTTVGNAATDHGIPADDVVLIGSPGPGYSAGEATDLGLPSDQVWVGSASEDVVTGLGRNGWVGSGLGFGLDPADEDFGAQRFQAEHVERGTRDPIWDHNQYYVADTESLYNMGHIVAGQDDEVLLAEHRHDPLLWTMQDPEADRTPVQVPTGVDP